MKEVNERVHRTLCRVLEKAAEGVGGCDAKWIYVFDEVQLCRPLIPPSSQLRSRPSPHLLPLPKMNLPPFTSMYMYAARMLLLVMFQGILYTRKHCPQEEPSLLTTEFYLAQMKEAVTEGIFSLVRTNVL